MAFLTLENLSFTYPNAGEKTLCDINLSIERGAFVTLMGATGSGKSTLLRLLKPELRQNGKIEGAIYYEGKGISALSPSDSAARIGYVAQNPQEQIVTDKVWHELAFTLENLGAKRELIARRIAETASFFGMDSWYGRDTATLSGGQKQLLNLAAVMTADPELLILDEPTAQLDPIAATRFIETVYRLNRETGLTVLICEHRAEDLLPLSDRVVILDKGSVVHDGAVREVVRNIGTESPYLTYLPTAARIAKLANIKGEVPLSIRDGQRLVDGVANNDGRISEKKKPLSDEVVLEMKNIYFRYERDGTDVLADFSMTIKKGEVFALLGANGAGKSTAAMVAANLRKPYSGGVKLFGKRLKDYKNGSLYRENISLLPQDAESVFIHETVGEELRGCEADAEFLPYDLTPLYERHPYDISGGERQLVALCKALASKPKLLIMDEPSKGLDGHAKTLLCDIIKDLKKNSMTILLITHDVEFAAMCADRCALFSQGRIAACDGTEQFLYDNRFYTTAASRITRRRYADAYTVERAVERIRSSGGER